jgi:hypothetical protein
MIVKFIENQLFWSVLLYYFSIVLGEALTEERNPQEQQFFGIKQGALLCVEKIYHFSHIHSHKTRQKNNYYLPRPRTNWGKQQFTYHSVSEWNSLPIELKQSTNLNLFKSKLKQFI